MLRNVETLETKFNIKKIISNVELRSAATTGLVHGGDTFSITCSPFKIVTMSAKYIEKSIRSFQLAQFRRPSRLIPTTIVIG